VKFCKRSFIIILVTPFQFNKHRWILSFNDKRTLSMISVKDFEECLNTYASLIIVRLASDGSAAVAALVGPFFLPAPTHHTHTQRRTVPIAV
jgi:hypothetical protein